MKILILTHTFPKYPSDSTAAFMHPLVIGLKAAGDEVTVLTPFHRELRPEAFSYPIITYKYIWPARFHVLGYSQTLHHGTHFRLSTWLLSPLLMFFCLIALWRLTRNHAYDIVSVHWIVPNGIIAALVCGFRKIPFTITLPGSDVYVAQKFIFFKIATRWAAQRASAVYSDSPQYFKELATTGATLKRRAIIPYPVDFSMIGTSGNWRKLRKKLGLDDRASIIVSVGRLIEKKGIHYMIRALPRVIKKIPNVHYIIVGDGDWRSQLEAEVDILHLRDRVHFVGNISRGEISNYYHLADVFVAPSIRDSRGNIDDRPVVIIEAMACARAVVATRFPGNALTIKNGITGILVPAKNTRAIQEAVVEFLRSPALRNRLGKQARQRVYQMFRHTVIGERYHTLFRTIILRRHV